MTRKKTIATTAFLLFLMILAIIIPFFRNVNSVEACNRRHHPKPRPPLGRYIHIQFTCSQTGKPIVNFPVTIGSETHRTDADGWVIFGSGFGSGTYTYTFEWWDGPHSKTVTIDCTKKDWYYYETLVNPEVHKWFFIDSPNAGYPPIEGLEVTLNGYSGITDATGYVEFILDYPFGDYTLEWVWNGELGSEPVYWAQFEDGIWEKENYLEPKSGGSE